MDSGFQEMRSGFENRGCKYCGQARSWSGSCTAIIGQSMGNPDRNLVGVNDVAMHLKGKGVQVNTFQPSDKAEKLFRKTVKDYRNQVGDLDALMPDHIGNPNNLDLPSVFYEMEKLELF